MINFKYFLTLFITIQLFLNNTNAQIQDSDKNFTFSPDNLAVLFGPYVMKGDPADRYEEEDLLPMIETIATRFSKIYSAKIWIDQLPITSVMHIPPAVARFNLDKEKENKINQTLKASWRPLKVFLSYSTEPEENSSLVNKALAIASKANSIFPLTVEYVIAEMPSISESTSENALNLLRTAKNISAGYGIKSGATFPLQTCGERKNLRSYLLPLLNHLDSVFFFVWLNQQNYEDGAEETVLDFTNRFERCKKKFFDLGLPQNLEIGFQTTWHDEDFEGNRNFTEVSHFWGRMNQWAMKTNTTVIMTEAFDQAFRNPPWSKQGWWRLKPKKRYHSSADFVFEEKRDLALKEIQESNKNKSSKVESVNKESTSFPSLPSSGISYDIVVVSVSISVTVFCVAVAGMVMLYFLVIRKMRIQRTRQEGPLSKDELQDFFEGSSEQEQQIALALEGDGGINLSNLNDAAYNKEFELGMESFQVDERSPLGMGAFGYVCLGKVFKDSKESSVAVKKVKKGCPSTALKGLLSEIKVMAHLGKHENVVSLVGAHTKDLKKGFVLVFTELCALGSLEKFLRKSKAQEQDSSASRGGSYMELVATGESADANGEEKGRKTELEPLLLFRWSYEIANGMEFLTSKHVVHADLATRNVLLTKEMTAKISDFGLSRRLYDYTNYVKSKQEPLPWRWMAPESLLRLEFNEKTDVWAYGITLWEIYSLGDIPYPGLSWSPEFASNLSIGLRPEEPRHNSNEMYSVMLRCWNNEAIKRPTFTELKVSLIRRSKNATDISAH